MASDRAGTFRTIGSGETAYRAFLPKPLPPDPALSLSLDDQDLIERANRSLGRLDSMTDLLPDTALFLYFYVRKEAVLSSQIEGTQSSLSDLLLFEHAEAPGVPLDDVQEVSNYVAAIQHGLKRLREGFPLSLRLLKEIHEVLLAKGRGSSKAPGDFRTTQNWVGGSRPGNAIYVPPPPPVIDYLDPLEKILHNDPVRLPTLLKAALVHVQFESIHPFLDGNGRLGRLLVTFLLCHESALKEPILYLSLYLKENRSKYYDLLQKVREDGDWEAWVRFFLTGVLETSDQAAKTAQAIVGMFKKHRTDITAIGAKASTVLRVHEFIQRQPIFSITEAAKGSRLSEPTVSSSVAKLEELGFVRNLTPDQKRNRVFAYHPYVDLLNQGTESPGK
jgi:Fic family protein